METLKRGDAIPKARPKKPGLFRMHKTSILPGSLFGRLTTEHPGEVKSGGEYVGGWACQCSCKRRVFRTDRELLNKKHDSCGCDARTVLPGFEFKKPADFYPKPTIIQPIKDREDAERRIGETWGSLTIIGVVYHEVSRVLVACSTCRTVVGRRFSEWGAIPCKCRSDQYTAAFSHYVGETIGKIKVKALSYEPRKKLVANRWTLDCTCSCGSSFSFPAGGFSEYVHKFPRGAVCPGCAWELEKKWALARRWRDAHGGASKDPTVRKRKPTEQARGFKIRHGATSFHALREKPTVAPKGLTGDAIPRHLLGKIWAGIQAQPICTAWQDREKFIYWARHAGYVPGAHLIRKDAEKPYHPMNCLWSADRSKPSNDAFRPEGLPSYVFS